LRLYPQPDETLNVRRLPTNRNRAKIWRLWRAALMIEDRLVDIEMKITYQEDVVQELNKLVYQQQKRLAQLEQICESLVQHIRSLAQPAAEGNILNERPPHF
jgi:SlyX protein